LTLLNLWGRGILKLKKKKRPLKKALKMNKTINLNISIKEIKAEKKVRKKPDLKLLSGLKI
jgi:hypothetical protein